MMQVSAHAERLNRLLVNAARGVLGKKPLYRVSATPPVAVLREALVLSRHEGPARVARGSGRRRARGKRGPYRARLRLRVLETSVPPREERQALVDGIRAVLGKPRLYARDA